MFNKKNIAVAMAAATTITAMAPVANVVFADVVENTQTEEIKALKEKVYELLNAKYTLNANLLAKETKKVEGKDVEFLPVGEKVYDNIVVKVGDKEIINKTPDDVETYPTYAAFEKAFDEAYAEMQNGAVIRLEYSSKYGVKVLEDGQIVNSKNVKYNHIEANSAYKLGTVDEDNIVVEGENLTPVSNIIGLYLDAEVATNQKEDGTYYSKVPVSNGYITLTKGDDKLDLDKPKFKVVDGYYVDAKGNSIKKFEAGKECSQKTVKDLIKLGGVVEGYYPVVEANGEIDADKIAIVKKAEAAIKEELTVGDLYEAEVDRSTVKGNELRKKFDEVVREAEANDNIRVRFIIIDKAGEELANEVYDHKAIAIDSVLKKIDDAIVNARKIGSEAEKAEKLDKIYKGIADAVDENQVKAIKLIFETTEKEAIGTEWSPAYEATITEGRNENFEDIVKSFVGDTEIIMRAGMDRYESSVEVSKKDFKTLEAAEDNKKHVVLVSGDNSKLVDGLTATPLAAQLNAPVLLTSANEIPDVVMDEIERLNPDKITIVGGTSGVSEAIETKLRKTYGFTVERLSGEGRYETSIAVANKMADILSDNDDDVIEAGERFDQVFVVGGNGVADALSVSAVAGIKGAPILLTPANELNADVKTFIQKYVKDYNTDADVYVVGGTNSVSNSVQNKLVDISVFSNNNKIEVKRLAGVDRQETNAAVIAEFAKMDSTVSNGAWKFVVANSSNASMVDALSAGAAAAKNGCHIVLADNELTEAQEDALKSVNNTSWKTRQVGYKVSTSVAKFVGNLVKRP